MKTRILLLAIAMVTGGVSQTRQVMERPVRQAVRGVHGAVAAGSEYATEAGMRTYYRGGNAVDVGVATHVRGLGHRAFALRPGRRSADSDPHQGRARFTRSRASARCRSWRRRRCSASARCKTARWSFAGRTARRAEGHDSGGRADAGAGAGHGGRGAAGAARIRNQVVPGGHRARHRGRRRLRHRRDARANHRRQPRVLRSVADFEGALHAQREDSSGGRDFPPAGYGSHACAPWRRWRRRRWPAGRRAWPPSTRCAIIFIAARSRTRSTRSAKPTTGLLRYEDMAAFKLPGGGAGFDHLSRLHGLQARVLEPGAGDDRGAEHSGRLRRTARAQFRRIHSSRQRRR